MKLKHFKPKEFENYDEMDPALGHMLDVMRMIYGKQITITGSWRPSEIPRKSTHESSTSGFWQAVDIRCSESRERFLLVSAAYLAGFQRIGIYDRHLHLDVGSEPEFDQDVCWQGLSK